MARLVTARASLLWAVALLLVAWCAFIYILEVLFT